MKERFEAMLNAVGKAAPSEDEQIAIETIERHVDAQTMARIREVQEEKFDLVAELKEWRKKFWDSSDTVEYELERQDGARKLSMDTEGTFTVFLKGGEKLQLSKGEVMSASEWGYWWAFDDSVPRDIQREVMSAQVRAVIADRYDAQLVAFGSVNTLLDERKRETYKVVGAENLELDTMPPGILAEKMIVSLLTKEMYDNPELSFSVKRVDVYEDVEHKIDFIVTVKGKNRGVKVGAERRVGIQFTMNTHATERKEKQLDRARKVSLRETHVDELILVTMPIEDVSQRFTEWSSGGKKRRDPRGPDHLWSKETKDTIIAGLTKSIE